MLGASHVSAATKPEKLINDQFSVSASVTKPMAIVEGDTQTIELSVTSKSKTQKALIDVELFNDKGERVSQDYFPNIKLTKGKTSTITVSTGSNLLPGNYRFGVGIFGPYWKQPHAWYYEMPSFVVVAK